MTQRHAPQFRIHVLSGSQPPVEGKARLNVDEAEEPSQSGADRVAAAGHVGVVGGNEVSHDDPQ